MWLVQSVHRLEVFLPDETGKSKSVRNADFGEHWESVYENSMSQALDSEETILLISGPDDREKKFRILAGLNRMILDDLEFSCTPIFGTGKKCNMDLNCLPILASYFCDILKARDVGAIRRGLSLRRPCVRCLKTMEIYNSGNV